MIPTLPFEELTTILCQFRDVSKRDTLDMIVRILKDKVGKKVFFIGNGGSAAIAAHMAADWTKAARYPAMCLSDAPSLTAWANDIAYDAVYAEQLKMFATGGDTLFAISSSGRSPNIINAANFAYGRRLTVITLTGFDADNPLSKIGDFNLHVPVHKYGVVEVAHHAILHHLLDRVIDA